MRYLVAIFDRSSEQPFDLDTATEIETAEGARHAAALFAADHLPYDPVPFVIGVVPHGTTFPCKVDTYEVLLVPRTPGAPEAGGESVPN